MRNLCHATSSTFRRHSSSHAVPNLIEIKGATFYRSHPVSPVAEAHPSIVNPKLYAGLDFVLPATSSNDVRCHERKIPHWAVIATSPTSFLNVLRGEYISSPPNSRTYPYLSSDDVLKKDPSGRLRITSQAIQHVGFSAGGNAGGAGGVRGAYLSARYESRREETDWTVQQYLMGDTELNPIDAHDRASVKDGTMHDVVSKLRLSKLLNMPVSNLSNGQTRRSRIAKALLSKPELLMLDEPFMGLDPPTLVTLSPILRELAYRSQPLLMLGLRPQDPIPDWITHLAVLGHNDTVAIMGSKWQVLFSQYCWWKAQQAAIDGEYLSIQISTAMESVYGKPLFSTAESLTPNGIRDMSSIEQVYKSFTDNTTYSTAGIVNPGSLSDEKRRTWQAASYKTMSQKTAQDWLTLCSILPDKLEAELTAHDYSSTNTPILSPVHSKLNVQNTLLSLPTRPAATTPATSSTQSEPLISLTNITVKYGAKTVLGHQPLNLSISRGSRILLLGPNGSGKTTLLSLLTSDHPQSYSLPIKFFGRTRLPSPGKPGLSLWEIQSRIGHSSPEVHAFYPRGHSVRQVLESAWAETFMSKPEMNESRRRMVDLFLRIWKEELCQFRTRDGAIDEEDVSWASDKVNHPMFGRLSFGTQRLLLLLRAVIKEPDIVILDEAFSGLSAQVKDKALRWLETGDGWRSGDGFRGLSERQAMVVVSHVREEVPGCVNEWVRLPGEEEVLEGRDVERGVDDSIKTVEGWNRVWGL